MDTFSPTDPRIVNLAKAVRQEESGGDYSAVGKSGEYGAFQYTEPTWQTDATKYGVNVPLKQATREQQNEVVAKKFADLANQGYTPDQIASIHNHGSPDYKGVVGTNSYGVHYDTPGYVNKVMAAYQQFKGQPADITQSPAPNAMPAAATVQSSQKGSDFPAAAAATPAQSTATQTQLSPEPGLLSKIGSGIDKFASSIASPFIGVGAIPDQLAIAGYNKLTGSNVQDPFASGVPSIGQAAQLNTLGQGGTAVTPLDAEKKAGDIAQVASYAIPGTEGVGGILGAGASGLLQGAGSAMSEGKDAPTVAVQGGLGTLLGAGVAGGSQLAGGLLKSAGSALNGGLAAKTQQGIKDAYTSALNLHAGELAYENRSGKDLANVLYENTAPLGRTADGKLDASQAIPLLKTKLQPLDTEAQSILANAGKKATVNMLDIASKAKQGIAKKATNALDKKSADAGVDEYIKAEIELRQQNLANETYGTDFANLPKQQQAKIAYDAVNVPVMEADKLKTGFWNATFDRNRSDLQNHIPYQIGTSMKDSIEKAVPDAKLGEVNAERGDLIDAIRRLQKLDGVRTVRGGRVGNIASGLVGTAAGIASGAGPVGAIAGDYFGTEAGKFLNNPATQIAIAKGKAKAAGVLPGVLGKFGKTAGNALEKTGSKLKKGSRVAGLLANNLTK